MPTFRYTGTFMHVLSAYNNCMRSNCMGSNCMRSNCMSLPKKRLHSSRRPARRSRHRNKRQWTQRQRRCSRPLMLYSSAIELNRRVRSIWAKLRTRSNVCSLAVFACAVSHRPRTVSRTAGRTVSHRRRSRRLIPRRHSRRVMRYSMR